MGPVERPRLVSFGGGPVGAGGAGDGATSLDMVVKVQDDQSQH